MTPVTLKLYEMCAARSIHAVDSALSQIFTGASVDMQRLEVLCHEIAHAHDLGLPYESTSNFIGRALTGSRMPPEDADANEIFASAVGFAVFRKVVGGRQRRCRDAVVRIGSNNLVQYLYRDEMSMRMRNVLRTRKAREAVDAIYNYLVKEGAVQ